MGQKDVQTQKQRVSLQYKPKTILDIENGFQGKNMCQKL